MKAPLRFATIRDLAIVDPDGAVDDLATVFPRSGVLDRQSMVSLSSSTPMMRASGKRAA
jgi:hypothetical protein